MKLIQLNEQQISASKEVPGLLNCQVDYEVKAAKGRIQYVGPKFTPSTWQQVLSFFHWTFTEMNSESQVRLYVNCQLGRWAAWAFPQEARTGMSAREVVVQESIEKARERFGCWDSEPSDDWLYFGTAHHHCSASAFQSATDEQNERNQDGLHLTVGRLDSDHFDIHARLYLNGNCFEPDLSQFWPVDPAVASLLPPSMLPDLARHQLGRKVLGDFPEVWQANVIELKRERRFLDEDWGRGADIHAFSRIQNALEEIHDRCAERSVSEAQWLEELAVFPSSDISQIILDTCIRYGVTPQELLGEIDPVYEVLH